MRNVEGTSAGGRVAVSLCLLFMHVLTSFPGLSGGLALKGLGLRSSIWRARRATRFCFLLNSPRMRPWGVHVMQCWGFGRRGSGYQPYPKASTLGLAHHDQFVVRAHTLSVTIALRSLVDALGGCNPSGRWRRGGGMTAVSHCEPIGAATVCHRSRMPRICLPASWACHVLLLSLLSVKGAV